jgi:thioredoxin-related protein
MKRILAILLLAVTCTATSQDKKSQVDVDEVIRRGDSVTHTGDGFQAGEEDAIGASLALPADDSHKWFITIFTQRNCAPCEQLKRDWASSKELQAWARPGDQKNSYAHFGEVRAEDGTQRWRLQKYGVVSFPVIVVQPPLSGEHGDASTVVFQRSGYDGNPAKLAADMSNALKSYVAKLYRANQIQLGYRQLSQAERYDPPPAFTPAPVQPSPFYPAGPGPYPVGPALQIPPVALTATPEQLRAACPGADGDWILSQLTANATVEQAQANWKTEQTRRELQKLKEDLEKANPKPSILPTVPAPAMSTLFTMILTLLGAGGLVGVYKAVQFFRGLINDLRLIAPATPAK